MARTKQTARLCCAQKVPRKQLVSQKIARKSGPGGKGRGGKERLRSSSSSSSQAEADVSQQQFSIKFDNQPECQKKAIKEPLFQCKNCKAYLNFHSELQNSEPQELKQMKRSSRSVSDQKKQELKAKGSSIWVCEFCDTKNEVPAYISKPKEENPCYFLKETGNKEKKAEQRGQKMILYCIDISGSMDTQFQGKTRLDAVKEAIRDQIKRMKFQGEKVKVAVVTFGSTVNVKHKSKEIQIPTGLYYNFDGLAKQADQVGGDFALSVQTHHKYFEEMVSKITTYGSTALGPALVTSIQLAGRMRGSKIVLCTDGMANVGLLGPDFYTRSANYAKEKGVMVSILSIRGDNCNLKELGKLTLSTGGSILKIDPNLLGSEFNKISREQVFGTDSNLRIVVNQFFQIENAHPEQISKDKTILTQDFGNFTADTELTFNFVVLSIEAAEKKGVSMEIIKKKRLPMQIQLTYTNPDGERYLQVVNDHRELTENRADLLNDTNFALFAASTLQKASKFIKEGKLGEAEAEIKRFRSLVDEVFSKKEKKEDLQKFGARIDKLEAVLNSKKMKKEGKGAISIVKRQKKSTKIAKQKSASRGGRGRGRGRASGRNASESESDESQDYEAMDSDSEECVLNRQIRARSQSPG